MRHKTRGPTVIGREPGRALREGGRARVGRGKNDCRSTWFLANDDGSNEDYHGRDRQGGLMVDRRACPLGYRLSYIVRFEIEDALEPSLSRGDSKRTRGKDDRDENEPYGYPKHFRKPSRSPLPRQHTFAAPPEPAPTDGGMVSP